jgi:hypothetical protein
MVRAFAPLLGAADDSPRRFHGHGGKDLLSELDVSFSSGPSYAIASRVDSTPMSGAALGRSTQSYFCTSATQANQLRNAHIVSL